jgi:hypothetical protein
LENTYPISASERQAFTPSGHALKTADVMAVAVPEDILALAGIV